MSRPRSRRQPPASRPKPAQKAPALKKQPAKKPAQNQSARAAQRELATKRRGELAELTFSLKAYQRGFGVSKPYGDSERYDTIIDARDLNSPQHATLKCHLERSDPTRKADQIAKSKSLPRVRRGDLAHAGSAQDLNRISNPTRKVRGPRGAARAAIPPALDPPPPLWRVQVKCSTQLCNGLYRVNAARRLEGRAVPYLPGEIDFLAAYIIPEDTWYIVPLDAFLGLTALLFRRQNDPKPGLYDQYREAWHLLRPKIKTKTHRCHHCGADTPCH